MFYYQFYEGIIQNKMNALQTLQRNSSWARLKIKIRLCHFYYYTGSIVSIGMYINCYLFVYDRIQRPEPFLSA